MEVSMVRIPHLTGPRATFARKAVEDHGGYSYEDAADCDPAKPRHLVLLTRAAPFVLARAATRTQIVAPRFCRCHEMRRFDRPGLPVRSRIGLRIQYNATRWQTRAPRLTWAAAMLTIGYLNSHRRHTTDRAGCAPLISREQPTSLIKVAVLLLLGTATLACDASNSALTPQPGSDTSAETPTATPGLPQDDSAFPHRVHTHDMDGVAVELQGIGRG